MNWIVLALHGRDPRYVTGALRNAEILPKTYGPDWNLLVYYDGTVPGRAVGELRSSGVVALRRVESTTRPDWRAWEGRFWRLLALEDPLVRRSPGTLVCHRDVDSRTSEREMRAVVDWCKSGKLVHIMRDHPHHVKRPMLSGMWGWKVPEEPDRLKWIVDVADRYLQKKALRRAERPWSDDVFMGRWIYPKLRKVAYEHDTFAGRQFPTATEPGAFVGEIVNITENGEDEPYLPDREARNNALTNVVC